MMNHKVRIQKTTKCDTRALDKTFTEQDVFEDTRKHIEAVICVCTWFCFELMKQVHNHDYTKIGNAEYLSLFTNALKTGLKNEEFYELEWWKQHKELERHHLNANCPEDVNLIDVIEMLADCVSAGLARTGNVYDVNISNEILQKAVKNTVEMLKDNIEVID